MPALAGIEHADPEVQSPGIRPSGPIKYVRRGTLILEPEPKADARPERTYRLMLRVPGGVDHVAPGLTNRQAWGLAGCGLGLATPEDLGVPAKLER